MNLIEAEQFFKKYDGHGFHMFREETLQYENYKELNIDLEIEEQWRQEIIASYFQHFFNNMENVWINHDHVISVLMSSETKIEENCKQLLNLMKQSVSLDKKQKILIIENMAGRTLPQQDGGCYLICSRTHLGNEMNLIMNELMNFECDFDASIKAMGWQNMNQRFMNAVESYKQAYRRFHH